MQDSIAYGFLCVKQYPASQPLAFKVIIPPGRETQGLERLEKGAVYSPRHVAVGGQSGG